MIKIKIKTLTLIKLLLLNCILISYVFSNTCDAASGWCFEQSAFQSFYNFDKAQLSVSDEPEDLDAGTSNGAFSCPNIDIDTPGDCDAIGAFIISDDGEYLCGSEWVYDEDTDEEVETVLYCDCIGWQYKLPDSYGIIQVPVMGVDSTNNIIGLSEGEIPIFKIWDASEATDYLAIALNKEFFVDCNEDGICAYTLNEQGSWVSNPEWEEGMGNGCWDDDEDFVDQNDNQEWDPSIIPGFQLNEDHNIKELKGLNGQTDCNGVTRPDDATCLNDIDSPGCAIIDDCGICSGGDTCIALTQVEEDGSSCVGPYVDCACECFGDSFIGDCEACLSSDKDPDYNIDCKGDCHPDTPKGSGEDCLDTNDADCGLRKFDSLFSFYADTTNGCCNPIYMTTWYDDEDMDMLGDPDLEYDVCLPELIPSSIPIVQNYYDLYPDCFSNSVDDCGECDGFNEFKDCSGVCFGTSTEDLCGVCDDNSDNDNLSCTGCTDSDASNYNPDALFYDGSCFFEVWPGDTDRNASVGASDIIPIGIFWGEMGSNRVIDSGNDYTWQSQLGHDNWNNKMALFADANGDGIVDIFDILVVLINWGECVCDLEENDGICDGDANGDGIVDIFDECGSYGDLSSFYDGIDLELYRDNFEYIYHNIPEGYDNNPIQSFLEEMFGFESVVQLPQEFKLHQNRPNPFNPSTNIVYEIPVEGNIKIIITNMLGEVVNQYESYISSPGIYNYEFDASLLPSGVYIYHLQSDTGINLTSKMMLIK